MAAALASSNVADARAGAVEEPVERRAQPAVLPPAEWTPARRAQAVPAIAPRTRTRAREYRSIQAVSDGRDASGPLDVTRAAVGQRGRDLVVSVRTEGRWGPAALAADPTRRLCLDVWRGRFRPGTADLRLCVRGRARAGKTRLTASVADARGLAARNAGGAASITRADRRHVGLLIPTGTIGLGPGRFVWRVRTAWASDVSCEALPDGGDPCLDLAPGNDRVVGTIVRVRLVRCVARGPRFVLRGSPAEKVVALTFDDGPSGYTPAILRILRRAKVPATFFVVGQMIRGRGPLLRGMLRAGHEIANHSWNHANLAGGGARSSAQLAATNAAVERVTGFRPCAFRAPYGAVGGDLVARARRLGMTTIGWDVDTNDWRRPGSSAIYRTAVARVRRGSIVLMHDGGGPRTHTVQALSPMIRTLRARGYRFATVADLLGLKLVYGRARG